MCPVLFHKGSCSWGAGLFAWVRQLDGLVRSDFFHISIKQYSKPRLGLHR
jgi:hypothetical protein